MSISPVRCWLATGLMLLALPGVAGSASAGPEFGGMPQPEPDCVNSERRTIASGGTNGVTSVFAIDLNGDGDVDVLSASTNDDTIAWHENDGNDPPSFTQHIISTNADGASSVFAADLDGDGDVDVVSASANDDTIAWYESNGSTGADPPVFIERSILTNARGALSVHVRDLDGDGDMDILSASFDDSKITAALSDRLDDPLTEVLPPGFTELVISLTASGAASVHTDLVDGDALPDVLSASRLDDKIAWYKNLGVVCNDLETVCTDDTFCVDSCKAGCDGVADCETICEAVEACILRFDPQTITTTADGATSVYSADLDGDGDTDVLSASAGDKKIAWYEQEQIDDGMGNLTLDFTKRVISGSAEGASAVFAADLDDDGDVDVISASRFDGTIAWYENLGGGNFGNPTTNRQIITADAPGAASVFAFDRDGVPGGIDVDVVAASSVAGTIASNDKIVLHRSDGAILPSFTENTVSGGAIAPEAILAVDVDGDAGMDVDVIAANAVNDSIVWYENDGADPPSFTSRVLSPDAPQAVSLFWANLDRGTDTDMDLLAALAGDDSIAWYENLGGGNFGGRQDIALLSADGASSVFSIDLDGDTDFDVLSASADDDKIAWYENLGGGDFGNPVDNQQLISNTADGARSVFAIDIDGDSDIDVLSASNNDSKISWYENEGLSFTERVISGNVAGARSVVGADVDQDGDNDVLAAASDSDSVLWFENEGRLCDDEILVDMDMDGVEDDRIPCTDPTVCMDECKLDCPEKCEESPEADCVTDCETDCEAEECLVRFRGVAITSSADFVRAVLAANIDNDVGGFLDIVAASSGDDSVSWHQQEQVDDGMGNLTVSFTERPTTTTAESARAIAVEDINGDGALDIVTGFLFEIAWHQGNVPEACRGFDATGDDEMDGEELALVGGAFGEICFDPMNPGAEWWVGVDYNEDCQIDGDDLAILTSTGVWGRCIDVDLAECSEELICSFTCP